MKEDALVLIAVATFVGGILVGTLAGFGYHRHHHEIIKTNIGEFILRDGKLYGVYELTRDVQGNMVAR
jgi:hypothetical protein